MLDNLNFGDILDKYKYKYDFMKGLIAFIKSVVEIIRSIAASVGVELPTLKTK
ncbi:MAG: hypothetical protein IJL26_03825 [Clostridia bacterium]|nr:hypothetical protein [Clostridia bacterium]